MFSYNKGRHSVYSLTVHLVFVTKRRGKVFNDAHLQFIESLMDKVCDDFECELLEFNGEEDHVHLLVSYPPKLALLTGLLDYPTTCCVLAKLLLWLNFDHSDMCLRVVIIDWFTWWDRVSRHSELFLSHLYTFPDSGT